MTNRLRKQIESLKKQILLLVADVEENVRMAVVSLQERDLKLAEQVLARDRSVDIREVELEEECLKLFALYQPVANDLRFIVAMMKINNDLERISDLAVNIAERVSYIASQEPIDLPFDFTGMGDRVQKMLRNSVDALVSLDVIKAYQVCAADDEIDDLNRTMYNLVEQMVQDNPGRIRLLLHYLGVSRHLERIADSATNIAEDIIYMVNGEIVRHRVEDFMESKQDREK